MLKARRQSKVVQVPVGRCPRRSGEGSTRRATATMCQRCRRGSINCSDKNRYYYKSKTKAAHLSPRNRRADQLQCICIHTHTASSTLVPSDFGHHVILTTDEHRELPSSDTRRLHCGRNSMTIALRRPSNTCTLKFLERAMSHTMVISG